MTYTDKIYTDVDAFEPSLWNFIGQNNALSILRITVDQFYNDRNVGKNPSLKLINLTKNIPEINLLGWVPDIRPHLSKCKIAIVPIRIGGGTRMKIYEAMAMKRAVISTSIGAEGLPVEHKKNFLIADDRYFRSVQIKVPSIIQTPAVKRNSAFPGQQF